MTLNPIEGLKQTINHGTVEQERIGMTLNPIEGLKRSEQVKIVGAALHWNDTKPD